MYTRHNLAKAMKVDRKEDAKRFTYWLLDARFLSRAQSAIHQETESSTLRDDNTFASGTVNESVSVLLA